MEIPFAGWIPSEMVIDSLHDDHLDFDSFHSENFSSHPYQQQQPSSDFHSSSPPQVQALSPYDHKTPEKQLTKRRALTPPRNNSPPPSSSSPQIISFGTTASSSSSSWSNRMNNAMPKNEDYEYDLSYLPSQSRAANKCYGIAPKYSQFHSKSCSRSPFYAQEHVIAERKRREKLNQRIIALSAIIPGLRKMDKASVLEGATKYLKQLQERVNTLEQQVSEKTGEVTVKKSWLLVDEETSSFCDENSCDRSNNNNLPEIEARVSEKFVLLKVQCLERKGCLSKILEEVEKLNLRVLNTSVLPFGSCILDITILAQMDEEFNMEFEDFVKNLRRTLRGII